MSYNSDMAAPVPKRESGSITRIDVRELVADPAKYIDRAKQGERFVLYGDGRPVAELNPARAPRPIGWAKGEFTVPPEFFDPLPDDIQKLYQGE